MNWHQPDRNTLGFLATIGDCISGVEARYPGVVPDLRAGKCLVAVSDYSGEHGSASWSTYCYVITQLEEASRWVAEMRPLRAEILPDGRRMAFKRLGDRIRGQALPPFLAKADDLHGLLICFAFQRRIESLFTCGKLDPSRLEYEPLRQYPAGIAEKLLRVTHLLALLVAGLSGEKQDLLWLTDEDPMVPTAERLGILTDVIGRATAHILPHGMGHLRVVTARSDPGDLSLEDLLAVPDLAAGMLAEVLRHMIGKHRVPTPGMFLARSQPISAKIRGLADWLSDNTQVLKRLVIIIDEAEDAWLRATHLRFHGSRDVVSQSW